MKQEHKDILSIQKIDPLQIAEDISGESYKTNDKVSAFGFFLQMKKSEDMEARLKAIGDTTFSNNLSDYLRITTEFGFKVAYTEKFMNEDGIEECMYVLFLQELGLILCFDTFTMKCFDEPHVNGANLYFNWSPNSFESRNGLRSSGSYLWTIKDSHMDLFEKDLSTPCRIPNYPEDIKNGKNISWDYWQKENDRITKEQNELFDLAIKCGKRFVHVGDIDAREALITTIKYMFENGKFLPVWQECAFLWLTHYMEHGHGTSYSFPYTEHYDATKIRMSAMPEEVQKCINNTYKK